MKNVLPIIAALLISAFSFGQHTTRSEIRFSKNVNDSFDIFVSIPPDYSENEKYAVVYYCDANLKSGLALRNLISKSDYRAAANRHIFVGIGHRGNFHVLRRRDFILPTITGTDTSGRNTNYGQTEKFYQFLEQELIPSINSTYSTDPSESSILGHSLGGLFAFYCLFKSESLFKNYFSLSPALWIDKYSIYKFNRISNSLSGNQNLYFSSGSKETLNRILKGTDDVKLFLDQKKYSNLKYDYDVWEGKTHNSQVLFSLDKILKEKLRSYGS